MTVPLNPHPHRENKRRIRQFQLASVILSILGVVALLVTSIAATSSVLPSVGIG